MNENNKNEFLRGQLDLLIERKNPESDVKWEDITDYRADYIGTLENKDTVRKGSKLLYEYYDAGWIQDPENQVNNSSIASDKEVDFGSANDMMKVKKEKIKAQTERIETNRWIRELARDEMITEYVVNAVKDLPEFEKPEKLCYTNGGKAGILCYGDEHFGTEYQLLGLHGEILNEYSPEIFEERMWKLYYKALEIINKEKLDVINIYSFGDFSDGILRVSQLMKLRYGVVDGTIAYAKFISKWLLELTKKVHVVYQQVAGNHTELRMINQPKGTFKDQNMDLVLREYIKARLEGNPNFEFKENPTGYIYDNICGYTFLGIHGEVKNMENAIKDFSHTYNEKINYFMAGHLHHKKEEEVGIDCEVINLPSVIGGDAYSLSLNKMSNAGAKMMIFEEGQGKTIEYSIKLN